MRQPDYLHTFGLAEVGAAHSDARSGQVVDDRIRPAAEAGFAVGSAKPNLIVIDEIDGATGGGDNVKSTFSPLEGTRIDVYGRLLGSYTSSHSSRWKDLIKSVRIPRSFLTAHLLTIYSRQRQEERPQGETAAPAPHYLHM